MPTSSLSVPGTSPTVSKEGVSSRPAFGHDELIITFGFRCNLACSMCLVEDALNVCQGIDLETLGRLLKNEKVTAGVRTIILSGAEVTMEPDLERYVTLCRSVPGVEHIRLQTNAVRLSDRMYLNSLIALGVDEYFVSLHGATDAVCDGITRRQGSFQQITQGIRNIAKSGATLMTNTVITQTNFRELPAIARLVLPLRPKSIDFWGYLPRVDRADSRGQLARVGEVAPVLRAVLDDFDQGSPKVTVKHFPRCLLGRHGKLQDNSQPTTLVDDALWDGYPLCACIYEGVCSGAGNDKCRGLPFAYVRRFGWEEDVLCPLGSETARREVDYWEWARGGGTGGATANILRPESWLGFPLLRIATASGGLRLVFEVDKVEILVDVQEKKPGRRCFARSASVDMVYSIAMRREGGSDIPSEFKARARALLERVGDHIIQRDDGRLWGFISPHVNTR